MRGRLAAVLTAALLMVPLTAATAGAEAPKPKCPSPSADSLPNHCDDSKT